MRQIIKLFLMLLFFIKSAQMMACPDTLPNALYYNLKSPTGASWLDINSIKTCEFSIRYYPCNIDIQNKIDYLLPSAIKQSESHCQLKTRGIHKKTEGFCTLQNVTIYCGSPNEKLLMPPYDNFVFATTKLSWVSVNN